MPEDAATTAVLAALSRVEVTAAETPEQLRERAQALDAEFTLAVAAPMRLSLESATLKARASAIERAREAEAPVTAAEAALAEAEERYAVTAEPEEKAATRCAKARHGFERARDELEQAQVNSEEPARLVELDIAATASARVDDWEQQALTAAQAARGAARQDLDRARAALTRTREALERAEAAVDAPLQAAGRPLGERFEALVFCWPIRVSMRSQPGWEMDATDLALARWLCEISASDLHVVPEALAAQIRQEATREVTRQMHQASIVLPDGRTMNVGQAMGLPSGMAGR